MRGRAAGVGEPVQNAVARVADEQVLAVVEQARGAVAFGVEPGGDRAAGKAAHEDARSGERGGRRTELARARGAEHNAERREACDSENAEMPKFCGCRPHGHGKLSGLTPERNRYRCRATAAVAGDSRRRNA